MDIDSLFVFVIVGIIAGFLAGKIMKGRGFGLIGNMVVGILGALIAGFIFPAVGISLGGGIISAIIGATIGAVILLFVVGVIKKV